MSHANYLGFSLEDTTAIEITVGPKDEEVTWILPKELLTHDSDFFKAAFNGTFAEAKSRSISMPEDNPKAFRLFVQWLYFRDITLYDVSEWLEAWILGDKLGNIAFRDCAMTILVKKHEEMFIRSTTVATAYRKSVLRSKLRKWALEQLLFDSTRGWLHPELNQWIPVVETEHEVAADIAKAVIGLARDDNFEDPSAHLDAYLGK